MMDVTTIINRRTVAAFLAAVLGLFFFVMFLIALTNNNLIWILWLFIEIAYIAFSGAVCILYAKWKRDMEDYNKSAYETAKESGKEVVPLSADEYHHLLKKGYVITKDNIQVIDPNSPALRKISLNEQATMNIQGGLQ